MSNLRRKKTGTGVQSELFKADTECSDDDIGTDEEELDGDNLTECQHTCANQNRCKYFILGKKSKLGKCFWEPNCEPKTDLIPRPNQYDLYVLQDWRNKAWFRFTIKADYINTAIDFDQDPIEISATFEVEYEKAAHARVDRRRLILDPAQTTKDFVTIQHRLRLDPVSTDITNLLLSRNPGLGGFTGLAGSKSDLGNRKSQTHTQSGLSQGTSSQHLLSYIWTSRTILTTILVSLLLMLALVLQTFWTRHHRSPQIADAQLTAKPPLRQADHHHQDKSMTK